MKIAVLGAGAMGCLYGGALAEAGHEVWLIDVWKQHVDTINRNGLKIEGVSGKRIIKDIKATTKPEDVGKADLVIVFVKATLTGEAVKGSVTLIGDNTTFLTLQNGLGNIEKISEVAGRERVIAGVTAHGSTMLGPGHIRHAGRGDTSIGELDGKITERVKNLSGVFNEAGFHTHVVDNVIGMIWSKLMANIGINALTALTGLQNGQLLEFRETEELLELAVKEAAEVAGKKGIKLQCEDPVEYTKKVCKLTAANRSSMLQDVMNKRTTEIEVINGAIVREGENLGVPTPINKTLTNLISVIQKSYN